MFAVLLCGVPALVILVTLYTGWLGLRFYIDEVIKAPVPDPGGSDGTGSKGTGSS